MIELYVKNSSRAQRPCFLYNEIETFYS